eukprot:1994727-Rhodomonas_salina.3
MLLHIPQARPHFRGGFRKPAVGSAGFDADLRVALGKSAAKSVGVPAPGFPMHVWERGLEDRVVTAGCEVEEDGEHAATEAELRESPQPVHPLLHRKAAGQRWDCVGVPASPDVGRVECVGVSRAHLPVPLVHGMHARIESGVVLTLDQVAVH